MSSIDSPVDRIMLTIFAAIGEMERDLLVERIRVGLAKTKQQGKMLGFPTKTTGEQRGQIIAKHQTGATLSELARQYGVSRLSIARIAKSPSETTRQQA
jgi:putative DNA-invertase from lambdoid prophage Rac